jgi:transposase-like protein
MTIGATPEGKKELVGLLDGLRESAQSWRELLLDLKRRGLVIGPELAVGRAGSATAVTGSNYRSTTPASA